MENRSLVTIANHTREKIMYLLNMAHEFEMHPNRELLKGKVVATLFFEPSTRTRLSFETAANRLGAKVIGFADPKITSGTKGETLKDTIMMVSNYADVICMRHYLEGSSQIRKRGCTGANHQRRRRSKPAPFTNHARPLHYLRHAEDSRQP